MKMTDTFRKDPDWASSLQLRYTLGARDLRQLLIAGVGVLRALAPGLTILHQAERPLWKGGKALRDEVGAVLPPLDRALELLGDALEVPGMRRALSRVEPGRGFLLLGKSFDDPFSALHHSLRDLACSRTRPSSLIGLAMEGRLAAIDRHLSGHLLPRLETRLAEWAIDTRNQLPHPDAGPRDEGSGDPEQVSEPFACTFPERAIVLLSRSTAEGTLYHSKAEVARKLNCDAANLSAGRSPAFDRAWRLYSGPQKDLPHGTKTNGLVDAWDQDESLTQ